MKENQWTKIIENEELPYVLNPKSGYIISANNFAQSESGIHGISYSFTYQHRFVRIRELLEEKIRTKKKLNAKDM